MNLCEFIWFFVNLCEFMWIHVNLCEFTWIHVNLCEFMRICVNLCAFMWIYVNLCEFMWIYLNLSVHGGVYFTFLTFLLITRGSRSVDGWRLFVPYLFSGCPGGSCGVTSPGSVCKIFGPEKVPSKKPKSAMRVHHFFFIFWPKWRTTISWPKIDNIWSVVVHLIWW